MDQILDELDAAQRHATYGAAAAVVGVSPRTLMKGRVRSRQGALTRLPDLSESGGTLSELTPRAISFRRRRA